MPALLVRGAVYSVAGAAYYSAMRRTLAALVLALLALPLLASLPAGCGADVLRIGASGNGLSGHRSSHVARPAGRAEADESLRLRKPAARHGVEHGFNLRRGTKC